LLNLFGLTTLNWLSQLLLKLPSLLTDIMTTFLLYQLAKKYLPVRTCFKLAVFYLFNPITWYNSAFWGQVDSVFTFLIVIGFLLIGSGKISLSTIPFIAAVLMKPQGIFFLPVLFFELLRQKKLGSILSAAFYALITILLIVLPFSMGQNPGWLIKLYLHTADDFPFAAVNADNFFNLVGGNFVSDSKPFLFLTYRLWGYIFFTMIILFVAYLYLRNHKNKNISSLAGLILVFGAFLFLTRMHERYFYPAPIFALFSFAYWQDKRLLRICSGISMIGLINMCMFPYPGNLLFSLRNLFNLLISLGNLFLFGYLLKVSVDLIIKNRSEKFGDDDTISREIFKFGKGSGKLGSRPRGGESLAK
jgi:Gpi18-like mannosyltransferase